MISACPAYAKIINITKKAIPVMMHRPLAIMPNMDRVVKMTLDAWEILSYAFLLILRNPLSAAGNGADESAAPLPCFLSSSAEIFRVPIETSFSTKK